MGYSFRLAPSTDRIAHTTAFVTPAVEHCLERGTTNLNATTGSTMSGNSTTKIGRKGRKEMFLFNDALNIFYLRLYGVRHG